MTSNKIRQIVVYVRRIDSVAYIPATFKTCIFEQLGIVDRENNLCCNVKCKLEDNKLFLELPPSTESDDSQSRPSYHLLKHPPFCPLMNISEEDANLLSEDTLNRGINVGVAILLETSDECVLISRRAQHMRTFPNVWVPPGGHIELDESLEEAGLREFEEETGLSLSPEMKISSCNILALWESVYPSFLALGLPKRHHSVIYMHVCVNKTSDELEKKIMINSDEVDAIVFLPINLAKKITGLGSSSQLSQQQIQNLKCISLNDNGEQVRKEMDVAVLLKQVLTQTRSDMERISTGTRFALEMWCRQKSSSVAKNRSQL